jgi:hypothetical protein
MKGANMVGKRVLRTVPLVLSLVLLSATGAATATILEFIEIQQQGVDGVDGLSDATSATVSPDGLNVYATGGHIGQGASAGLFSLEWSWAGLGGAL